jgi:hypothetical protein
VSTAPAATRNLCCSPAPRCETKRASVLRRTFDLMWREAMVELVDALEAEDPALSRTAPQAHTRAALAGPGPAGLSGLVLVLGGPVSWRLFSRLCALTYSGMTLSLPRYHEADQAAWVLEHRPAPAGPALHGRRIACAAHTRAAWAQDLPGWAAAYVRHLQTVRKLAEAHDQVVQPQKRADLRAALEAALARLVELRHYLARADLAVASCDSSVAALPHLLAAWRHLLCRRSSGNQIRMTLSGCRAAPSRMPGRRWP